jgi:hypothetical protein
MNSDSVTSGLPETRLARRLTRSVGAWRGLGCGGQGRKDPIAAVVEGRTCRGYAFAFRIFK